MVLDSRRPNLFAAKTTTAATVAAAAAAAADDGPHFIEWREQFISQERGSRVVHYYLEDSSGESHLAVVGTEKSVRHMLYVVSSEFCEAHGSKIPGVSGLKWRSRREVVNWLTSFLPICSRESTQKCSALVLSDEVAVNRISDPGSYLRQHPDHLGSSLKVHSSGIVWSGVSWTCGKQLRHFQAFRRNGAVIAIHSFVYVMSEEENRYLAYLEDMYEDKKGQKKVKVRWFHQNQEFLCPIPQPKPHPREVFITPSFQVISVECVDDLATVLTAEHYEKCFAALPYAYSEAIHLCFRQYSKNRFKPFDLMSLSGYFDQAVFSCLDIHTVSGEEGLGNGNTAKHARHKRIRLAKGHRRGLTDGLGIGVSGHANQITACRQPYHSLRYSLSAKKPLSVKFIGPRHWLVPPYKADEKIELLCQDSGIRGCWFRCTVLQLSQKRLKVRYNDVRSEDGFRNLEEWVPAFKSAAPDKLGMRCPGRLSIRPCLTHKCLPDDIAFQIGTPVDAWWSDGWWEGVVIGVDNCGDNSLHVYSPGEDVFLKCQRKDLRISRDWVDNRWVDIDAKPDILSAIYMISPGQKLSACPTFTMMVESGSSAISDRKVMSSKVNAIEENRAIGSLSSRTNGSPENMKQGNPRKRCRDEGVDGDCAGGDNGDGSNS